MICTKWMPFFLARRPASCSTAFLGMSFRIPQFGWDNNGQLVPRVQRSRPCRLAVPGNEFTPSHIIAVVTPPHRSGRRRDVVRAHHLLVFRS
jgi:hypothetical protein